MRAVDLLVQRMPRRPYCAEDLSRGLRILPRDRALQSKYIQINPPTQKQALIFDLDRPFGWEAAEEALLPPPSVSVINDENGHAHLIYLLSRPIVTSSHARLSPLKWASAIERGLRRRLRADPGYSGLIVRNPLHRDHHAMDSGRLYELKELDRSLDVEDKRQGKKEEVSGLGRNCELFNRVRFWAYENVRDYATPEAWHTAVIHRCEEVNGQFYSPLPWSEVKATAKSISKWVWAHRDNVGKRRAVVRPGMSRIESVKIGKAEQKARTQARVQEAVTFLVQSGKRGTKAEIMELTGLSRATVTRALSAIRGSA